MRKHHENKPSEGPIMRFCMGLLTAAVFSIPTSILLWFALGQYLASWCTSLGSFWFIFALFAFISVFSPKFLPSLLGKVWQGLIKIWPWF